MKHLPCPSLPPSPPLATFASPSLHWIDNCCLRFRAGGSAGSPWCCANPGGQFLKSPKPPDLPSEPGVWANHSQRLQTWMQIKADGALSVCLALPTCRQPAPAVYSQIGKMRGPSAGQSVAQRPPELHMGWKIIYLLGLKQKQSPREAGGWLFLCTIRSSLLLIK